MGHKENMATSDMGLYGLGVMGQNFALNVASKGFTISVANRSESKVDSCVKRAEKEELADKVVGFKDLEKFVGSLKKPRRVMFLVTAGKPVDLTIEMFASLLEEGDILIDGGNEWYENSERRAASIKSKGIMYLAMGVSGGEYGARHGPSLMPGGPKEAYDAMKPILERVAAMSDSGPFVSYLGKGGAGNYVKMVHNGIEYGDMQLIAETYDLLQNAGMSNKDIVVWKDSTMLPKGDGFILDKILDATGNKGTGKMTVMELAQQSVAGPTISAALNARFLAFNKDERVAASKILKGPSAFPEVRKEQLIKDVRNALYCSKICSYAQGMKLIAAAS